MQKLNVRQDSEEVRAVYGAGSYVLSAAYKQFFVPHATWHNWTVERKKDHVQKFRNYKPNVSDNFKKPKNAGRKPNYAKRIRTFPILIFQWIGWKKFLLVQIVHRLSISLSQKVVKL